MTYPGSSYPTGGYAQQQQQQQVSKAASSATAPAQYAPPLPQKNPIFMPYATQHFYTGGRCRALLIGICYKNTRLELDGPGNDVKIMLRTLERIQFPLDECVILTDDGAAGFDRAVLPTKSNILYWLEWLCSGAETGDVLFLHVSGHAVRKKQAVPDGTEMDDCDSALVPLDHAVNGKSGENVILDDQIFDIFSSLPAGVRVTALFDTCNSGGIMDLPYTLKPIPDHVYTSPSSTSMDLFAYTNRNACNASIICFSGCADGYSSADAEGMEFGTSNTTGQAAGAATCALSETLMATAGLTYGQILRGMRAELAKRGLRQVPQLTSSVPVDLSKPFSLFGNIAAPSGYSASSSGRLTNVRARAPVQSASAAFSFPKVGEQHWTAPPNMTMAMMTMMAGTNASSCANANAHYALPPPPLHQQQQQQQPQQPAYPLPGSSYPAGGYAVANAAPRSVYSATSLETMYPAAVAPTVASQQQHLQQQQQQFPVASVYQYSAAAPGAAYPMPQ